MSFPLDKVAELLVQCHRRCCICHRFCGIKIETDHIRPKSEGGDNCIDNAIAVCFECHAEIHSYNDNHPRGRKFRAVELQGHKDQWLKICSEHPESLLEPARVSDVGPLQALVDELQFNEKVASHREHGALGAEFYTGQFLRAIQHGSIAILRDEIRECLLDAYVAMESANSTLRAALLHGKGSNERAEGMNDAQNRIRATAPKIAEASKQLVSFLRSEPG